MECSTCCAAVKNENLHIVNCIYLFDLFLSLNPVLTGWFDLENKTLFSNKDLWSRVYYLGATHNVFKFLEVGIMAEGGDDSAQDIHQPSNRDVHSWQKYYSIFAEKYLNNIRKSVNQEAPMHAQTQAPRIHAHTMTLLRFV